MANVRLALVSPIASGGVAHFLDTSTNYTAGKLFEWRNNGVVKASVAYNGDFVAAAGSFTTVTVGGAALKSGFSLAANELANIAGATNPLLDLNDTVAPTLKYGRVLYTVATNVLDIWSTADGATNYTDLQFNGGQLKITGATGALTQTAALSTGSINRRMDGGSGQFNQYLTGPTYTPAGAYVADALLFVTTALSGGMVFFTSNSGDYRFFYGSGNGTLGVTISGTTGGVTIASLAGTGTRTVVADANGVLSAP